MDASTIMELVIQVGEGTLMIIGGATVIFRVLVKVSKYTKTQKDDNFVKKILDFLYKASEIISGNLKQAEVTVSIEEKKS